MPQRPNLKESKSPGAGREGCAGKMRPGLSKLYEGTLPRPRAGGGAEDM